MPSKNKPASTKKMFRDPSEQDDFFEKSHEGKAAAWRNTPPALEKKARNSHC